MDKNTIWAIVLSTIVIVVSWVFIPKIMEKRNPQTAAEIEQAVQTAIEEKAQELNGETAESSSIFTEEEQVLLAAEEDEKEEETVVLSEEIIKFKTNVADIEFSTKGGDIVSYRLTGEKNIDKDTNLGIQISDNVSANNRTLGLSLGAFDNKIINDIFSYEWLDSNTLLFKKTFKAVNSSGKINNVTIGKKYTFIPDEYMFKLDILIHGDNAEGLNLNGVAYTLRTSPQIGPHYDQKSNRYDIRQFIAYNGKKAKKVNLAGNQTKRYEKDFLWGATAGKYFEEVIIPTDTTILSGAVHSCINENGYVNAQAFFERKAFTGSDVQDSYYIYFGPRDDKDLKRYNVAEKNAWNFGGHKITESLQSGGFTGWIEVILKWCLEMIHKVVPNWGLCIIILTIILKLCLFPMSKKQSMSSVKMQELQPKIQALQEKYKNDQQKQQVEMQKIYKEANYNPASGCLPLILQFFVLYAMYQLFNNYFDFRGATFIPGWIPDLSCGDSIWSWEKTVPLISGFTGNNLRLLPIIYVASQILFGKFTSNAGATAGSSNTAASMKFMTYGMPILFFFLFYSAPSGLLLYWITSNLFQLVQQLIINKSIEKAKAAKQNGTAAPVKKTQTTLPPKAKKNK